ncbi:MAG: xanthine dehydrogenase family protein subunit M [Pirellulales bacterium]
MNDFEFVAPRTIDEAVAVLAKHDGRAKLLAGGTDILVQLRERLRQADVVIDVKKIAELQEMRLGGQDGGAGGLWLGAAVPCYRIYGDARVASAYPGLVDAARIIGGWQIQSRASIGGNLCNSSPAADSIPTLLAYSATCHLAGPGGRRTLPVAKFCTAPGRNALARGEMLVAIEFPPPATRSSCAYERFIPRNEMDIAVVGAASWVRLDLSCKRIEEARIALAAVAPTPVVADEASQWLAGQPVSDETFAQAGERAKAAARPISDKRGPAEYRTHLVEVLVRRTLARAVERATHVL